MIGGVNPSGPGLRYRCHANRKPWKIGSETLHSPLFFREFVEIERVLPLMAAILIISRTESNLGKSIKST